MYIIDRRSLCKMSFFGALASKLIIFLVKGATSGDLLYIISVFVFVCWREEELYFMLETPVQNGPFCILHSVFCICFLEKMSRGKSRGCFCLCSVFVFLFCICICICLLEMRSGGRVVFHARGASMAHSVGQISNLLHSFAPITIP